MHKQNIIFLAVFFTLVILIAPVFAGVSDLSITEYSTSFNFLDVGNATAVNNSTLWVNVQHGGGFNNSNFTNVTFVLPFGVNPATRSVCNATQQNLVANYPSTNDTFNLTHNTCTIGYWNLSLGGTINVSLNVTANMSALAMNHIARGANTVPARIYAFVNATNNTTASNYGVVSGASLHNSTSFWINPRPYAYVTSTVSSNGTVYIMGFNQTRNGYVVDSPIMQYNASIGRPEFINGVFANVMYMNATFMDAPSYVDPFFMEMFSYNLTFKIVVPFAAETTTQSYLINSPAVAGNQTLMPMQRQLFTVGGMMGENFTMSMGFPNSQSFDIYYGVNSTTGGLYVPSNLTTLKGITISFAATYSGSVPMLNITATNLSALNNTDISILFTLINGVGGPSSPVFLQAQQLSGFDMTAPPKFGENITNAYIINISNALDNYTLSNLSIRFMIPDNVTVINGSSSGKTHVITDNNNSSFTHSSGKATYAYSPAWSGATNYTKSADIIDRMGRGMEQGTTVRINFTFIDANLNMPQFNRWIPGNQTANTTFVTLNLTTFMSFPVMNESNNTPGTAGSINSYNATIQMPQKGRMNLTDKVPGLDQTLPTENIQISVDGETKTTEDGNVTLGSLLLNNLDSGTHTISVTYTVPSQTSTTGGGGGEAGGGGGAAGAAATITPDSPVATVEKAVVGTTVSLSIQVTAPSGGGTTKEAHKMEIVEIVGTLVRLKFTSEPVYVNVNVGETKYVDINGDGINDVKVTVNSVSSGTANITVELLAKAKAAAAEAPYVPTVSEPEVPTETTTEAPTGLPTAGAAKPISPKLVVIIVAALIGVLALVYFYSQQPKEK